jgi:hypothetical protein
MMTIVCAWPRAFTGQPSGWRFTRRAGALGAPGWRGDTRRPCPVASASHRPAGALQARTARLPERRPRANPRRSPCRARRARIGAAALSRARRRVPPTTAPGTIPPVLARRPSSAFTRSWPAPVCHTGSRSYRASAASRSRPRTSAPVRCSRVSSPRCGKWGAIGSRSRCTVYLPAYPTFYGRAAEVLPAVEHAIESAWGLWTPVVLHWGWEAGAGWRELERLAGVIAHRAVAWDEFLVAVGRSRASLSSTSPIASTDRRVKPSERPNSD